MRDEAEIDTSRELLATAAYADDQDLRARQSLYNWQQPTYDLAEIVAAQLQDVRGVVVDVGCGNGRYVQGLRAKRQDLYVIGMDISPGIMVGLEPPLLVADAQHMPFEDGQIAAVLAMHMLYHVEDVAAGISELARVSRPEGVLIASTNAREDKIELDQLWSSAAAEVLGIHDGPRRVSLSSRFTLNDAPEMLRQRFSSVSVIELPGIITVESPDPVIAHLASYRAWADEMGVPFDLTLERARHLLQAHITQFGSFTINCLGGILICRGPVSA